MYILCIYVVYISQSSINVQSVSFASFPCVMLFLLPLGVGGEEDARRREVEIRSRATAARAPIYKAVKPAARAREGADDDFSPKVML